MLPDGMLDAVALVAACALTSAGLSLLLRSVMARAAPARPSGRGSHTGVTPQGGGVAVMAAVLIGAGLTWAATSVPPPDAWRAGIVLAAALALMITGLLDDIHGLGVAPRVIVQVLCAGAALAALPADARILPGLLSLWPERAMLLAAVVWFVNLTNFMDGLDLMTVAQVVPATAAIAVFALMGAVPPEVAAIALALLGGMLGFAPFNAPRARMFLGDGGSLPVGLLQAWMLVMLAAGGHLAAALLLPLYALADTGITVARRLLAGEAIHTAHRTHFYQRATEGGLTVPAVTARVFLLNAALAGLATITVAAPSALADIACLAAGALAAAALLVHFQRGTR